MRPVKKGRFRRLWKRGAQRQKKKKRKIANENATPTFDDGADAADEQVFAGERHVVVVERRRGPFRTGRRHFHLRSARIKDRNCGQNSVKLGTTTVGLTSTSSPVGRSVEGASASTIGVGVVLSGTSTTSTVSA